MRLWILRLHRWSTFALGALLVFTCVSGSILVFTDEIDMLLRPELFAATPGDVGPDRALAAAQAAVPGKHVGRFWFPQPERPVYVGEVGGRQRTYVHVDPGTGAVLGIRSESVMHWIRTLHASYRAGVPGLYLVGFLGVALLLMMATGIYLWWPGLRKFALGFRFRKRGGAALINYDLHNLTGIFSLPVLALITVTGVAIVFVPATRVVLHALWLRSPGPLPGAGVREAPVEVSGPRLTLAELTARTRDTIPGFDILSVVLRPREAAPVQVRLSHPDMPFPDGITSVTLDPYTGRVLATNDLRAMTAADRFRQRWMYTLHIGRFGGLPMRWIYVVAGLIPVVSVGTGLVVWWLRRQGRLALAERRAAARAA